MVLFYRNDVNPISVAPELPGDLNAYNTNYPYIIKILFTGIAYT